MPKIGSKGWETVCRTIGYRLNPRIAETCPGLLCWHFAHHRVKSLMSVCGLHGQLNNTILRRAIVSMAKSLQGNHCIVTIAMVFFYSYLGSGRYSGALDEHSEFALSFGSCTRRDSHATSIRFNHTYCLKLTTTTTGYHTLPENVTMFKTKYNNRQRAFSTGFGTVFVCVFLRWRYPVVIDRNSSIRFSMHSLCR